MLDWTLLLPQGASVRSYLFTFTVCSLIYLNSPAKNRELSLTLIPPFLLPHQVTIVLSQLFFQSTSLPYSHQSITSKKTLQPLTTGWQYQTLQFTPILTRMDLQKENIVLCLVNVQYMCDLVILNFYSRKTAGGHLLACLLSHESHPPPFSPHGTLLVNSPIGNWQTGEFYVDITLFRTLFPTPQIYL